MYPSDKYPVYGIFVRNFVVALKNCGAVISNLIVINKKSKNITGKIFIYAIFYIKIVYGWFFYTSDVVYIQYPSHVAPIVVLLNKFKKRKIIINFHGTDLISESRLSKLLESFLTSLIGIVVLNVVPSSYYQDKLCRKYKNSNCYVYPSGGINLDIFKTMDRGKCRKQYSLGDAEFVIGFVSRIDKGKGWLTFLQALNVLKEKAVSFKAIVAGDGLERELFLSQINKYELENNVIYLGQLKQEDIVILYNSIDMFIFPSEREQESLGLVGLEAMACGVPVVGSDIGGIKTYVEDEINGFLFGVGDYKALAQKIINYSRFDVCKKNRFSKNALDTALKYDSKKVNKELYEKINSII